MTIAAGHTPDLSLPRRTLLGLGRSLAAASLAVLLMTGLAGPAAADTRPEDTTPSPSPSASPSQPADPGTSPTPGGNAPPEFVDCAGILVQAGVPESIGFQITDADDDPVTLTAGESSIGAEITIEGHILTYTAPPEYTGDELLAVTADDGQGGTAFCEVYVKVGPAPTPAPTPDPTDPSPNPTDSPSTPPTQDPTTPAPSPTSSTPDPTGPTQGPTSAPAPSSEPSSAPSGSSPDDSPSASAPAGGDGSGTPPGTPGTTGPGNGQDGGSTGGADGGLNGGATGEDSSSQSPEGGSRPATGAPDSTATPTERLRDLAHDATVSSSLQAVEDARMLVEGISAGMTSRPGNGQFPDIGNGVTGSQDGSAQDPSGTPHAEGHRASQVSGSSIWLFAGVGLLMVVLIGLAAAALPRASRRG